ncbi:hypothetical protein JOB18_029688 [Solea senegalensis]|uniref:DDE Tnp4 domain-containing protein n=1 Tax=Solea senegalensis TaxID=28829 RepID=A0AAV6PFL5_SOLSE|nr:protein ALP1-like [Solea senegalensis]KAG7463223.1 hypothetical protein JOB18_029688 [Solea senegalensis]
MDASKKVFLVVALSEYKQLLDKYSLHLKKNSEEDERRRRILISTILRSRQQVILKTGTAWEEMQNMDERTFSRHFRVSKPQFEYLAMKLQVSGLEKEHCQGLAPVPVTKKVLMFLWYMSNQSSFKEMSETFEVSQSTAHRVISEVLNTVCTLGPTFVSWPDACEKAASAAAFHRLCGLRDVIGAIDGCHIRVQRPPVRGGDYMNCKSYYSVLLQGIVDDRGRFLDIFAGPPGRVDDTTMLRASSFYDGWQEKMGEYRLLGDGAYTGHGFPFVVSPRSESENLTEADELRNCRIGRGMAVAEEAFGRLKCKWRRLRDLRNTRIDAVVMTVMAACFLHNMCNGTLEICQEHPQGCPRQGDENEEIICLTV